MTSILSLLVVILATTGMSNPLSHSDGKNSSTDDAIVNLYILMTSRLAKDQISHINTP